MREYQVLVPCGGVLCDGEVVRLQTQPFHTLGLAGRQGHQPSPPASGKSRSAGINRIRVVAKSLVKRRIDANRIQPLGSICMFRRDQIHLKRGEDLVRNIGELTVERLTTNDHELLFASDAARSPQHMINLLLLHSVFSLPLSEASRRMAPIAEV